MSRIVVVSGDILPYPGLPTTGAGLRAWGLAQGLAAKGHDVIAAMPRAAVEARPDFPAELADHVYTKAGLTDFIRRQRADVVVLQHWPLANLLDGTLDVPLVIDFHGPLLLEVQFQQNPALASLRFEKLKAIQKADFFTCAGEKQRYYFEAWLMMAGVALQDQVIATIPVSLSPDLPVHASQGDVTFVYGGVFLPWQDPVAGLTTLAAELAARQTGQLKFFGGKHPFVALPTKPFEALQAQLQHNARVHFQPLIPRDQLLQEYCRAHVALDVMQRNAERELAFTTRTVEYLWCGLPVIYHDYAELSAYIDAYQAGWTVDPTDQTALRAIIAQILTDPAEVARRSENAQRLVHERLTWTQTIAPLDAFCRQPTVRAKDTTAALQDHAARSLTQRARAMHAKLCFHLRHEGWQEALRRAWKKLSAR